MVYKKIRFFSILCIQEQSQEQRIYGVLRYVVANECLLPFSIEIAAFTRFIRFFVFQKCTATICHTAAAARTATHTTKTLWKRPHDRGRISTNRPRRTWPPCWERRRTSIAVSKIWETKRWVRKMYICKERIRIICQYFIYFKNVITRVLWFFQKYYKLI